MIRKQIMALVLPANSPMGAHEAIDKAADLAEARERELLLELENERRENDLLKESVIAIKSCADAFEFDAECRKDLLAMHKAERAQMIAELRTIQKWSIVLEQTEAYLDKTDRDTGFIQSYDIEAVINKYEVRK